MHKIICEACRGTKKIKGMGMMEKSCTSCFGLGYIDKEPKDNDIQKRASEVEAGEGLPDSKTKETGRRGRPKKQKEEEKA